MGFMLSYQKISKEVGHNQERSYPTLAEAESLLNTLKNQANIEDFKEAMRYYRFLPVAHNQEEVKIIHTINSALIEGRKNLGIQEPKLSFNPIIKKFGINLKDLISNSRLRSFVK